MKLPRIFNNRSRKSKLRTLFLSMAAVSMGTIGGAYGGDRYLESAAQEAWEIQNKITPDMPHAPTGFDTFRHAYTSARLTQCFGAPAASFLMDLNEVVGQNETAERRRDSYNNDYAIDRWGAAPFTGFATADTLLSAQIFTAMQAGHLKAQPGDVPAAYQHRTLFGF